MGVIDFNESKLNLIVKNPEKYCDCVQILIRIEDRTIVCRDCGRVLDPFDYMVTAAEKDYNFYYRNKENYEIRERLIKGIDKLKRKERNIKARIRRANLI